MVITCNISPDIHGFVERFCGDHKRSSPIKTNAINFAELAAVCSAYGFSAEKVQTAIIISKQPAEIFKRKVVDKIVDL